ncbi:putative membrane protein [Paenibacillus macerans]|uniref:Putative membrane protein n=1 Tax=Paenibacillus macerans TaxID=44252 RepID=A0A090ZPA7_PAEMA|nr:putative membrane protein [Paenibacillus macerans]
MKKAFFSMVVVLGLISVVVAPVVPSTPGTITANHGLEH